MFSYSKAVLWIVLYSMDIAVQSFYKGMEMNSKSMLVQGIYMAVKENGMVGFIMNLLDAVKLHLFMRLV